MRYREAVRKLIHLVCDRLLSQYDFMPTMLGYLGLDASSDQPLPGRDFSPVLRGESMAGDTPVFVLDEYGPTRMIRTQRWKYVHRYPDGPNEFYDLVNDPLETRNLVDDPAHSGRVSNLRADLEGWYDTYVDPRMDGAKNNVTGRGQSSPSCSRSSSVQRVPFSTLRSVPIGSVSFER